MFYILLADNFPHLFYQGPYLIGIVATADNTSVSIELSGQYQLYMQYSNQYYTNGQTFAVSMSKYQTLQVTLKYKLIEQSLSFPIYHEIKTNKVIRSNPLLKNIAYKTNLTISGPVILQ